MENLSYEIQMALVSFCAAVLIGGPVALIGTERAVTLARFAASFAMRRRLVTSAGLGLLGWAGAALTGLGGLPDPSGLLH